MMREYMIIDKGDCWTSNEVFDEDLYECVITLPEARHAHEMREAVKELVKDLTLFCKNVRIDGKLVRTPAMIEAINLLTTITAEEQQ